jgi:hypothetical protein
MAPKVEHYVEALILERQVFRVTLSVSAVVGADELTRRADVGSGK